ncbi:hypothetical protein OAO01_02795 [Oligoflexia bacterium]|nr:hypothetical protein [Oligoflexia bacterium]
MKIVLIIIALCSAPIVLFAQTRSNIIETNLDPRGKAELVVCSQNLQNYGLLNSVKRRVRKTTEDSLMAKELDLVKRFTSQACDVIAVQELLASNPEAGKRALGRLAKLLQIRTNRIFETRVSPSNDKILRLGYLVATDRADILSTLSYARIELPKLSEKQRPRLFTRGPFEMQLKVKPRDNSFVKVVTLVNMHFKSKRSTTYDPIGLEWETYRMEMAEALRRVVLNRHEHTFGSGETVLLVLGDRNSHFDAASARILEGVIRLRHFQKEGICRLSRRGVPLCQGGNALPQYLFSVLTTDQQTKLQPGTYRFNDIYSWLDDILMPAQSLPFAAANYGKEGDYSSGVVYKPMGASDHAMVWVRLNW